MNIYIEQLQKNIEITIERKRMKSVRLKVFPDMTARLSAPYSITKKWIIDFLNKKKAWLAKCLQRFEQAPVKENEKEINIGNGTSTRILGKAMMIKVIPSRSYKILKADSVINIFSPAYEDPESLMRQYDSWGRKEAKIYFEKIIDDLCPLFEKHGVIKPVLTVKKMKTLWGSCSRHRKKISLNYYLYKAHPSCIEYVVLHELAHFLYPRHNKDFYDFIAVYMPDWKERKKNLRAELLFGI